jgi:hypothetical protein
MCKPVDPESFGWWDFSTSIYSSKFPLDFSLYLFFPPTTTLDFPSTTTLPRTLNNPLSTHKPLASSVNNIINDMKLTLLLATSAAFLGVASALPTDTEEVALNGIGKVTWFYPGLGACGKRHTQNDMVAALNSQVSPCFRLFACRLSC